MADIVWLMRRLKAMSAPEVIWRLLQKSIQNNEKKRFKTQKLAVTAEVFNRGLGDLRINANRMHLDSENLSFELNTQIPLLGGYKYELYKKQWHAGFQTKNKWPNEFSYSLEYKQRDDIGDARTNWELNRHFQFALLAKNYVASKDGKYLNELIELFEDWNNKNPFLWGISWTSVMEIAIRCSNWCYVYCFLSNTDVPKKLLEALRIGILNMTNYIANHYSRFSSANNHLIIEAYTIGQTGVLCDYKPWIDLAVRILTRELPIQNYSDGINKELSLHYQSFYMEAMGLMMRLLIKNGIAVPNLWNTMLNKMCGYLADCIGNYGEVVVFGDDDEGKILDLQGGLNHYKYVLGLFSCLLETRYTAEVQCCENLNWLFSDAELQEAQAKNLYKPPQYACYKEGGNTILRNEDRHVLIGIDHAALGFGSIAAHGHADALSFQMFVDGHPVFADPGTYIYHCDLESRNAFRRTENHNTVCVDGKDQSEMLGAFLWGKKAECELIDFEEGDGQVVLKVRHNGYAPVVHTRSYKFDGKGLLQIVDELSEKTNMTLSFILGPEIVPNITADRLYFDVNGRTVNVLLKCEDDLMITKETKPYSKKYGIKEDTFSVTICGQTERVSTTITVD